MAASPSDGRWRRLAWFVGLWLAGVAAVGAISLLLRAVVTG
jgi:hypothetical protein